MARRSQGITHLLGLRRREIRDPGEGRRIAASRKTRGASECGRDRTRQPRWIAPWSACLEPHHARSQPREVPTTRGPTARGPNREPPASISDRVGGPGAQRRACWAATVFSRSSARVSAVPPSVSGSATCHPASRWLVDTGSAAIASHIALRDRSGVVEPARRSAGRAGERTRTNGTHIVTVTKQQTVERVGRKFAFKADLRHRRRDLAPPAMPAAEVMAAQADTDRYRDGHPSHVGAVLGSARRRPAA